MPLDGSPPRRLSAIPTADANYGVGRFQLATALLPGLQVRKAADADRGRWPVVARIGVALAVGAAATAMVALVQRRRRQT